MAEVYDDWYADVSDVEATVALLRSLHAAGPSGPVLELAVGTGRLAVPLAAAGLEVHGVDASPAMLTRLAQRPGGDAVHATLGDMADEEPRGPFALAFVAYNSLFNLTAAEEQARCIANVARRLLPGGCFVVDAFVPEPTFGGPGEHVALRSLQSDAVVLSVSRHDGGHQRAEGAYVELRDGQPVRVRPWAIRWSTLAELDTWAEQAGLRREHRWADILRRPFDESSAHHVSVYRRPA
ncbi:MAG: class I SAM-dependent DNA methyltransferase [Acidimicrobiales bacterium]